MKKIIYSVAVCLIALVAGWIPFATASQGEEDNGVSGSYRCSGTDFVNNQKYQSKLKVVQTEQTYQFLWTSSDGKYKGTGFLDNDSSTLMIAFQDKKDPRHVGALTYKISQDGSTFEGRWVLIGKKRVGSESCQKAS